MGQDVRNDSRVCRTPPGPPKGSNQLLRPNPILVAVSLTFVLTTATLTSFMMLSQIQGGLLTGLVKGTYFGPSLDPDTPQGNITIFGNADFHDTALLERWPGDGSPENPYIIEGLNISEGSGSHCIAISNTQVSFTISNCSFHGQIGGINWEAGIYLENVTNGEIVHNTFSWNDCAIYVSRSDFNTISDNNCTLNGIGIELYDSDSNTISSNNCTKYGIGIYLIDSDSNTVSDNNCTSNHIGISLDSPEVDPDLHDESRSSHSNIIANNTCNSNDIGIYLYDSYSNIVEDNTCLGNAEHDIFAELWKDDFDDENLDDWTIFGYESLSSQVTIEGNFSAASGMLTALDDDINIARRSSITNVGTWSFDMFVPDDDDSWATYVYFMSNGSRPMPAFASDFIAIGAWSGGTKFLVLEMSGFDWQILSDIDGEPLQGWHHIDVSRTSDGHFYVYFNGTLRADFVSNDVTSSTYLEVWCNDATGAAIDNLVIDDTLIIPPPTPTTTTSSTPTSTTPTTTPSPPPFDPVLLALIGGGIAGAFIVVAVVFLRRR